MKLRRDNEMRDEMRWLMMDHEMVDEMVDYYIISISSFYKVGESLNGSRVENQKRSIRKNEMR